MNKQAKPTLTESAAAIALRIGAFWSASFLCSMYGLRVPILTHLSTFLAVLSIFILNRYIYRYRVMVEDIRFGRCLLLAFMVALMSGLLTDAVQYVYFAWLDNGQLLQAFDKTIQLPEYQQMWSELAAGITLEEVQQMMQQMSVADVVRQFVVLNVMLALPVALLATPTAALKRISK